MNINNKISLIAIYIFSISLLVFSVLWYFNYITIYHESKPLEIISDMDYQQSITTQEAVFKGDSLVKFNPPENSIPSNANIYPFSAPEFAKAESTFTNPLEPTAGTLEYGKYLFQTNCIYCHGYKGKGDGPIIKKVELKEGEEGFPAPPDLTADRTKNYSDARIFHILSAGQNLMFPVSHKLSETERWSLVLYIRELQKNN